MLTPPRCCAARRHAQRRARRNSQPRSDTVSSWRQWQRQRPCGQEAALALTLRPAREDLALPHRLGRRCRCPSTTARWRRRPCRPAPSTASSRCSSLARESRGPTGFGTRSSQCKRGQGIIHLPLSFRAAQQERRQPRCQPKGTTAFVSRRGLAPDQYPASCLARRVRCTALRLVDRPAPGALLRSSAKTAAKHAG